jgi:lipoic acid synthetase
LGEVRRTLREQRLNTVCESARCPNRGECYGCGTATFMILGEHCTRNCRFCSVPHGDPPPVDKDEPRRLAVAVRRWGLSYVVATSVTRDDLPDGGAAQFVAVIDAVGALPGHPPVEVLVPDFAGNPAAVDDVTQAGPAVFAHNVETVPRLYPRVRPGADYERSLAVLRRAAANGLTTKSGLMLGLGEKRHELERVFAELAAVGVRSLTLGQYLRPTTEQLPVERYLPPDEFAELADLARNAGIDSVLSGPLVRSSYRAAQTYRALLGS